MCKLSFFLKICQDHFFDSETFGNRIFAVKWRDWTKKTYLYYCNLKFYAPWRQTSLRKGRNRFLRTILCILSTKNWEQLSGAIKNFPKAQLEVQRYLIYIHWGFEWWAQCQSKYLFLRTCFIMLMTFNSIHFSRTNWKSNN